MMIHLELDVSKGGHYYESWNGSSVLQPTYSAVCCWNQPHCIQDLLGYQTLIIEVSLEYQGDGWLGYDQRLQQRAAPNPALI